MMGHPSQAALALHAGGDLGPVQSWLTARHLSGCAACRQEVARYGNAREILPGLVELPDICWERLGAEIKANVRLGLEAGECVRVGAPREPAVVWTAWRAAAALASFLLLVGGCVLLERAVPAVAPVDATWVQSTREGIQVRAGGNTLSLMNGGARRVTLTMDAQGSMGARYTDPETGYVTINTVYAQ